MLILPKVPKICKQDLCNSAFKWTSVSQNNLEDLDPSYCKTDLDLRNCFGREKCLETEEIRDLNKSRNTNRSLVCSSTMYKEIKNLLRICLP